MILATQKSLLPKERSDELILSKNRKPNWKIRFRNFLNKEGVYNFAKMAERIKTQATDYVFKTYGDTPDGVFGICELVWSNEVSVKETIIKFLENCSRNNNYILKPSKNVSEKDNLQKHKRGFGKGRAKN